MSKTDFLQEFIIFFSVTIVLIPLFKRLRMGSVFGYLVAGILVGPHGLALIGQKSQIVHLADLGLVLLMFVIGQELTPTRLSKLKEKIFIDGSLQIVFTLFLSSSLSYLFTKDLKASLVIGSAVALSSTAFVLSYLKHTKQLTLSYGQSAFSILLLQDIFIVPVLTVLPLLSESTPKAHLSFNSLLIKASLVLGSFLFLKFCLKPLLRFVQKESGEVFTAFCLLVILGMGLVMDQAGLSKALGAFLAGVFLSESEFKKEVESVITPFKGMLMGVFFMTFGLRFNLSFFINHFFVVSALCLGIYSIKAVVLYPLGLYRMKSSARAKKLTLLMSQGGEFSFVVLTLSAKYQLLSSLQLDYLICAFILSLFVAPVFAKFSEKIVHLEEVKCEENPLKEVSSPLKNDEDKEKVKLVA